MINNLSDYKVPIDILEEGYEKSYSGSSLYLDELGLELDRLEKSLSYVYESLR